MTRIELTFDQVWPVENVNVNPRIKYIYNIVSLLKRVLYESRIIGFENDFTLISYRFRIGSSIGYETILYCLYIDSETVVYRFYTRFI